MKYEVSTIEEYLAVIPPNRKEIIINIISILHEYFPNIKGTIKYNMPTFSPVCSIASQKHYISLYIFQIDLVEKYRKDLGNLKVGKSCIRFNNSAQIPSTLIHSIFSEIKNKK